MSNYYQNELSRLNGSMSVKFWDEHGNETKTLAVNDESIEAIIERFTAPAPKNVHFDRISSDVNGNPRYVMHFTQLLKDTDTGDSAAKYEIALKRARKFGGRKFNNKQYGGGIVFQSYNLKSELKCINEALGGEVYAGYTVG